VERWKTGTAGDSIGVTPLLVKHERSGLVRAAVFQGSRQPVAYAVVMLSGATGAMPRTSI
jgi:hypothetical protein